MKTRYALTMVTLALSAAACDAQAPIPAAPQEQTAPAESKSTSSATADETATVSQELSAARREIYRPAPYFFGGNIVDQDFYFLVGGACSDGFVRSPPVSALWNGLGYCVFDQWINPSNEHDCTARIHAHTNGAWGGGQCQVVVFEEPVRAKPGSCLDGFSNFCGGISGDGSCYCDPECVRFGDCCRDFTRVCSP